MLREKIGNGSGEKKLIVGRYIGRLCLQRDAALWGVVKQASVQLKGYAMQRKLLFISKTILSINVIPSIKPV